MRDMPSIYHYWYHLVHRHELLPSPFKYVTYVTYLLLALPGGCVVPPYIGYCRSKVWRLESIVRTRHVENDVYTHSTGSSAPRLLWVQTLQTVEVQWGIFEIKIGSAAYEMVYHHFGEMKFVGVIRTRCGPTGMRDD